MDRGGKVSRLARLLHKHWFTERGALRPEQPSATTTPLNEARTSVWLVTLVRGSYAVTGPLLLLMGLLVFTYGICFSFVRIDLG